MLCDRKIQQSKAQPLPHRAHNLIGNKTVHTLKTRCQLQGGVCICVCHPGICHNALCTVGAQSGLLFDDQWFKRANKLLYTWQITKDSITLILFVIKLNHMKLLMSGIMPMRTSYNFIFYLQLVLRGPAVNTSIYRDKQGRATWLLE